MQTRIVSQPAIAILSSLALLISSAGYADDGHDDDSDAVKYRHAVMESMSNHFAAFVMVFTGKIDRPDDLQVHADALAQTAATVSGLFPEGSEGGAALPIIWEEPDQVATASQEAADTTAALAKAVAGGNRGDIAKAFKAAGGGCKGCHERYKEEDD